MLSHKSVRIRYVASLLLVMAPILVFAFILLLSNRERSIQYTNNTMLQNFTHAAENISDVVSRLDYTASTAFSLENELQLDAHGNVTVLSDGRLCAGLGVLEERITPSATALFYTKGDSDIYSSSGKLRYGDYERQHLQAYDLTSSMLYSRLQQVNTAKLIPLYARENRMLLSGLAYAMPFPSTAASKGVLLFVLSNEVITAEFEHYMGDMEGGLYLYDSWYSLLYASSDAEELPISQAQKLKGTGVLSLSGDQGDYVVLRVTESDRGLHWMMLFPYAAFYAAMLSSQRLMLGLICALVVLLLALILWVAFFNYRPIQRLVLHVTGRERIQGWENELDLIRDTYDQTVEGAETLSSRISDMTPLVAQQFVSRMIFGPLKERTDFDWLSSCADMDFSRPWNAALYLRFSQNGHCMERAAVVAQRFRADNSFVAVGELTEENALCIIVNFEADSDAPAAAQACAERLDAWMAENGVQPEHIGVGRPYADPLQMKESFAEACAALQLAQPELRVSLYTESSALADEQDFRPLSPQMLTLLREGLHRGEQSIALRALSSLLGSIADATHSMMFLRFYCTELLSALVQQAEALNLPVSKNRLQHLMVFTSLSEFSQNVTLLVEEMCQSMRSRIEDAQQRTRQELLHYVRSSYKRADLSIQTVADETGIHKAQITSLIREETGQGFVQYISFLRLNEFKRLLLQSDATIRELIAEIGYTDAPNFLRKFKSIEGVTPSQYRQMHGR